MKSLLQPVIEIIHNVCPRCNGSYYTVRGKTSENDHRSDVCDANLVELVITE